MPLHPDVVLGGLWKREIDALIDLGYGESYLLWCSERTVKRDLARNIKDYLTWKDPKFDLEDMTVVELAELLMYLKLRDSYLFDGIGRLSMKSHPLQFVIQVNSL